MDVASRANMIQSVDGQVRLTTKSGAVFNAQIVRTEYSPKTLIVRPKGFTLDFEGFAPDTARLLVNKLRAAERAGDQAAPEPDMKALKKALARPSELPPKTSKAATKRAVKALKDATADSALAALRGAINCDLGEGVRELAARLTDEQRATLLREAVAAGSGRAVTELLASGALRTKSEAAGTQAAELLTLAAATGKLFAIRSLLADDAIDPSPVHNDAPTSDVRYPSGAVLTPLHWALANGHVAVVDALLEAGARLVEPAGLVRAVAQSEDVALLQRLLTAGLDPAVRDESGHPLLRHLGNNLRYDMLETMIAAGAEVNARYPDGSTLLLHALDLGRYKGAYTSFVKNLLDHGADPNLGRLYGRSALALAEELPFDPGLHHGERWLVRWIRDAGGEAHRDADAPALPEGEPPPPPPPVWKARIDPALARADTYEISGARLTVLRSIPQAEWSASPTPSPEWDGLGADTIALVRAKLEHVAGAPVDRGDAYKITFEYAFEAEVDGARVLLRIADWKARELHVAVAGAPTGEAAAAAVAALWELLTIAPLAAYKDRFRFDEYAGCRYRSNGATAFADFPKSS